MPTILRSPVVYDYNAAWPQIKRGENYEHYKKCWGKESADFHFKHANSYLALDFEDPIIQNQVERFGKFLIGCPHNCSGYATLDGHIMDKVSTCSAVFEVVCDKCKKEFAVLIFDGEPI